MRTGRPVLTVILVALALTGCGGDPTTAERSPQPQTDSCVVGVNVRGDDLPDPDRIAKACAERAEIVEGSAAPLPPAPDGDELAAAGRPVVTQAGCLACHRIGTAGNDGPGPDLSDIGERLSPAALRRTLLNPTAPMPSFASLPDERLDALVAYLTTLRGGG